MQRKPVWVSAALGLIGVAVWLWWVCERKSEISFLPRSAPAEWIVYPKPAFGALQGVAELPAVYRRSLALKEAPASATLQVRACRSCAVSINGRPVALPRQAGNWKASQSVEVSSYLKSGENTLSVTVVNRFGPPAMWLSLAGQGFRLCSDSSWEVSYAGAVWRPARLATEPPPIEKGNPLCGGERTLASIKSRWEMLSVFALLTAGIVLGGHWWFNRKEGGQLGPSASGQMKQRTLPARWAWTGNPAAVLMAGIVVLWVLLVGHNLSLLPGRVGYDVDGHLEYMTYIQTHSALPLADQGWEMHQSPLYYVVAAGVLNLAHLSATSFDGVALLRFLSLLIGLAHVALIFGSLRLIFPGEAAKQAVGLALAGFVPMQLYLTHYVTNETLAACLMSATIYLVLRLVRAEAAGSERAQGRSGLVRIYAGIGLCLGLALLTKVTALILVPFVGALVVYQTARWKGGVARRWLLPLTTVLVCLITCGWHYWRVWNHFGTPLVTGGDPRLPPVWWQDPGYRTAAYFLHFGRALTDPFLSGFASLGDGLYSTLWGDGSQGGMLTLSSRPAWNYEVMAASSLLALVPTVLVLAGLVWAVLKVLRQPEVGWLLVLGFALAMVLAILQLNLTAPWCAVAKSFYGLSALVALSAFGAAGYGLLPSRAGRARWLAGFGLGLWALTSYASFWIRADAPATQALLGRAMLKARNYPAALRYLGRALEKAPGHVGAGSCLFETLSEQGRLTEAASLAALLAERHPSDSRCQQNLASVLEAQGQAEAALDHSRRAVELAPDDLNARISLASGLSKLRRHAETISACREGLRLSPADPDLHFLLACALMFQAQRADASLASSGQEPPPFAGTDSRSPNEVLTGEAINHFRHVLELAPDTPDALSNLAWILATHPNAALRNGPEAVRLAERACALTNQRNPLMLEALAAAQAEAGHYPEAVAAGESAGKLLAASDKADLHERNRILLEYFRQGRPYRSGERASRPGPP